MLHFRQSASARRNKMFVDASNISLWLVCACCYLLFFKDSCVIPLSRFLQLPVLEVCCLLRSSACCHFGLNEFLLKQLLTASHLKHVLFSEARIVFPRFSTKLYISIFTLIAKVSSQMD